jgi:hypothetical protein
LARQPGGARRAARGRVRIAGSAHNSAVLPAAIEGRPGLLLAQAVHMRQARGQIVDVVLFVLGVVIIASTVAYLNQDIRRQLSELITGDRATQAAMLTGTAARVTRPVLDTFHSYWLINPWLVGFALVTLVLFIFIFKA